MRELTEYELENIYGGFIATITSLITVAILVVLTYKIARSQSAKVKLPGGTNISFTSKESSKSTESSKKVISSQKPSIKLQSENLQLKQLENISETYTSTPSNFLIKM